MASVIGNGRVDKWPIALYNLSMMVTCEPFSIAAQVWSCGPASGCLSETNSCFPAAWLFSKSPQPDVLDPNSLNPVVNSHYS